MRPLFAVFAILVAPVRAQEPEAPEIPEEEVLEELPDPTLGESRIFRGERDAPAVFVRLREGGTLQVKVGEEWKEVTLDDLGTFLSKAREEDDLAQRKAGKSGLEKLRSGVTATRLFLSLEAEPTVPWQHVQWIMTIAADEKYRKIEMSEGKRRLITFLPAGCDWPEPEIGEDGMPAAFKAEVHIVARAEQPAKWGDAQVQRPTEVRFKCGDTEKTDLADVAAHLKETKKSADELKAKEKTVVLFGVIKAGHKVPYARVFDVAEAFVAADIAGVDFYGTAIPPKTIRQVKLLPYPLKNYAD